MQMGFFLLLDLRKYKPKSGKESHQVNIICFWDTLTGFSIHIVLACSVKNHFLNSRSGLKLTIVKKSVLWKVFGENAVLCLELPGFFLKRKKEKVRTSAMKSHGTLPMGCLSMKWWTKMTSQPIVAISYCKSACTARLYTSQEHRAMPALFILCPQLLAHCLEHVDAQKYLMNVERSWTISPPIWSNREVVILGYTDQLGACHQLLGSSVPLKPGKEWWEGIIPHIKGVTSCTLSEWSQEI